MRPKPQILVDFSANGRFPNSCWRFDVVSYRPSTYRNFEMWKKLRINLFDIELKIVLREVLRIRKTPREFLGNIKMGMKELGCVFDENFVMIMKSYKNFYWQVPSCENTIWNTTRTKQSTQIGFFLLKIQSTYVHIASTSAEFWYEKHFKVELNATKIDS